MCLTKTTPTRFQHFSHLSTIVLCSSQLHCQKIHVPCRIQIVFEISCSILIIIITDSFLHYRNIRSPCSQNAKMKISYITFGLHIFSYFASLYFLESWWELRRKCWCRLMHYIIVCLVVRKHFENKITKKNRLLDRRRLLSARIFICIICHRLNILNNSISLHGVVLLWCIKSINYTWNDMILN